ncbi:hypothetical protein X801_04299, partial [Opisthorchis viverrini]
MHFADLVLREIAAEGLEGVTLERLWGYLSSQDSGFPFKLDTNSKQFIWEALLAMKCLSFYVNPTKDDLPGTFDRRTWLVDDDRGLFYETPANFRPRKFFPAENLAEIGSCPFYTKRVDVSDEVRKTPVFRKLSNVEEKRLLHFASRQGFVTTSDSTMKEACAFFKNKDPESIATEDLQMFAQENAIPRCGPQAPLVIVHLKNSANIEAWFSSFGAVKGIPPGARSEGESEEEEEAVEEVVDTESGDVASSVAPTGLGPSSEGNSSFHNLTPSGVAELQSDSKSSSLVPTLRACEKTLAKTQREKRRTFILNYLSEKRIVPSVSALRQVIWDHEAAAGLTVKMDHKSLHRIIEELLKSKLLVIHVVKSIQGELRFLCHPDIRKDDPLVVSAVEAHNLELLKKRPRLSDVRTGDQILLNQDFKKLTEKAMQPVTVLANLCPRLRRRLLLHEYLFYVLYVLPRDMEPLVPSSSSTPAVYHKEYSWRRYVGPLSPPDGMKLGWFSLNDLLRAMPFGLYLHLICGASLPKIMCRWLGLKKYLGKISAQELQELDGQLMLERVQDVPLAELFLFPLESVQPPGGRFGRVSSWLFSITRVRSMLNLLEEMTIHNLVSLFDQKTPTDPANTFLIVFNFMADQKDMARPMKDTFCSLPTARTVKVLAYLHRNAGLLDTRYANPAHRVLTDLEKCPFLRFHFNTMSDVANYWQTCEVICRNTPLGHRLIKTDLDRQNPLPVDRTLIPWSDEQRDKVVDDGSLPIIQWPSDALPCDYQPFNIDNQLVYPCGACGLNPLDFSYLSRNWDRKQQRAHLNNKDTSSESESDTEDGGVESVWRFPSIDRVPLNPEEPFWQWDHRLFEDTDFQAAYDIIPNLGPTASDHHPSESRRAYGFFSVTSKYLTRGTSDSMNKGKESVGSREGSPIQPSSVSAQKPDASDDDHTGGKPSELAASKKRAMQKPRKSLRAAQRRRPLIKEDRRSSRFRNPRCCWSPLEDQLVKPPKTVHAYARRMKFILVLRRSECTAVNILLARVSARPDLQRKLVVCRVASLVIGGSSSREFLSVPYSTVRDVLQRYIPHFNYGRNRWYALCRDAPNTAEKVFHSAVDCIISEFVPRLNQLRPEAKITPASPSTADIPDETASENVELPRDNKPPFEADSSAACDHEYRISGSRSEVEQKYSLFKLNSKTQSQGLADVGKNRVAVVVYSLYNYAMARLLWKATDPQLLEPKTECSSQEPLLVHSFKEHTSGGEVAVFLELMLQDQFLQFDMDFQAGSITFIRDATINEAVRCFENRYADNDISSDVTPSKSGDTSGHRKSSSVIRRELLPQLQEIPECFHDRQFWLNAAYSNRFRWFENRLSFCQSQLILRSRPCTEDTGRMQYLGFKKQRQASHEVIQSIVYRMNDRIMSSLELKKNGTKTLMVVPDSSSLQCDLEKFISEGRFTGRTTEEVKGMFGDSREVSDSMEHLLNTKRICWLGSTVSRFVHRRHIRLWLVHLKPGNGETSTPRSGQQTNQVVNKGDDSSNSQSSYLEPKRKRARVDDIESGSPGTTSTSLVEPKDYPSESSEMGFFFPECWCAEDGRPKPRALCGFLQALIVRLTDSGGTNLASFAGQYQRLFGQQAIRRLVF